MTGWALVALAIIAALTGSVVALLTDAILAEIRRFNAGADALGRDLDTDRAQAHQAGRHRYVNGRCVSCGLRQSFTELYDQESL